MAAKRPHVVIVGAGFGGLAAARGLRTADVAVTLGRANGIDHVRRTTPARHYHSPPRVAVAERLI